MMDLQRCAIRVGTTACVLLAGFLRSTALCEEPPALERIIEGLERRERLFFGSDSLLLRYERTETEDVIPSTASGGYLPAEWTLAFRGDKWFLEQRFTRPGKTDDLTVPGEPKTQVVRGSMLLEWRQSAQAAFLNEFDLGGNIYSGLFYTDHLALNVPKRVARSGGADIEQVRQSHRGYVDHPFLPDFLRENKRHYRVLPQPEEVEGGTCWVVEWPGMDRLCVDSQHGFAIRRRAYHWAPGKPLRLEIVNRDYREVKPGLWLPFAQEVNTYASIVAEKESLWGKVTSRSGYRLQAAEFDSLTDEFFEVQLPEGTRVIDVPRGIKYTVSKSEGDPFDDEIEAATELLERESPPRTWPLLLIVNVAAVAVSVAYLLWRRR